VSCQFYQIMLTKQAQKDIAKLSPKLQTKLKDILRNKIALFPQTGVVLIAVVFPFRNLGHTTFHLGHTLGHTFWRNTQAKSRLKIQQRQGLMGCLAEHGGSSRKASMPVFVKIVVASFFTNPYLYVFPDSAIPHAFFPSFGLGQTSVPGAWPWLLDTAHREPPVQPRLPLGAAVPV
jgi:hypothetical protein